MAKTVLIVEDERAIVAILKFNLKREGYEMFEQMIAAIQDETVRRLYSVRLKKNEEVKRERVANATSESVGGDGTVKKQPRKVKKIGRNEPCPCGSGKKYKNCCGRNA